MLCSCHEYFVSDPEHSVYFNYFSSTILKNAQKLRKSTRYKAGPVENIWIRYQHPERPRKVVANCQASHSYYRIRKVMFQM